MICLGILLCFVIESGNPCTLVLKVFLYCFFINVFPTIFSEIFLEFLLFRSWISLIDLLIILSFLYHFQTLYLSLLFFVCGGEIFLILSSNLSLGFAFHIYFKISKSLLCSLKVVILPSFLPYFFLPFFFLSSFSLSIFNPFVVLLFPVFFPCVLLFAVIRDFNQMSKNP